LFHDYEPDREVYDLADLTPQCGRRGDSLKLFLGWTFYGKLGYSSMIEHAFDTAEYLFSLLDKHSNFVLVSKRPLPCLQVCFYWTRYGKLSELASENDLYTRKIARELVPRGWMIDYAPGITGSFLRVVVSISTSRDTVVGLVKAVEDIGAGLEAPP
jgi:glutamate decarboxylase